MPATRWSTLPPLHHFMDKMVSIPHTKVSMSISTFLGILQLLCLFWKTDTMIKHSIGLWLYLQNIVANAQVFCLEHRTYANHKCTKANEQDVTVLVCPICSQSVRSVPNEDPNVTWERHVQTNCNPSNYAKANKKPRYAFSNQTGVWHSDLYMDFCKMKNKDLAPTYSDGYKNWHKQQLCCCCCFWKWDVFLGGNARPLTCF